MDVDSGKVSAKVTELKAQLAENLEEREHAEPFHLKSLIEAAYYINGRLSTLYEVQEGRFNVKDVTAKTSGGAESKASTGGTRARRKVGVRSNGGQR